MTVARIGRQWPYFIGLAVITLVFLLPQLGLLSLSLKEKAAVYQYPPRLIPSDPTGDNYGFALLRTQVPWYVWNSTKIAVLSTLVTLCAALPAAYVLSRVCVAAGAAATVTASWSGCQQSKSVTIATVA